MPELPEVETVRRQLEPAVVGRRIISAEVLDDKWTAPTSARDTENALAGKRIEAAGRRGKYLILRLEGGASLVMHLRMTGNLLLRASGVAAPKQLIDLMEIDRAGEPRLYEGDPGLRHLRARLTLDDATEVWFSDVRRFGTGILVDDADLPAYFAKRVGIEPLSDELTAEAIAQIAAGRKVALKSFLLNQAGIAGIGNIYADEALHRAGLHPLSPAGSIRPEHAEALRAAIVETLELALANGGSSIDDYVNAEGEKGSMQDEFLVHTREGQDCPRCGETIQRIVIGGRSSYFCAACQRRLRRRPRRRPKPRPLAARQ